MASRGRKTSLIVYQLRFPQPIYSISPCYNCGFSFGFCRLRVKKKKRVKYARLVVSTGFNTVYIAPVMVWKCSQTLGHRYLFWLHNMLCYYDLDRTQPKLPKSLIPPPSRVFLLSEIPAAPYTVQNINERHFILLTFFSFFSFTVRLHTKRQKSFYSIRLIVLSFPIQNNQ